MLSITTMQGRLASAPTITTTGDRKRAFYPLAVERDYKKDGEQSTDFFNCVAFGATAEFVEKYLKKGQMIIVEGRFKTSDQIDDSGNKIRYINLEVQRHYFCGNNKSTDEGAAGNMEVAPSAGDDFSSLDV